MADIIKLGRRAKRLAPTRVRRRRFRLTPLATVLLLFAVLILAYHGWQKAPRFTLVSGSPAAFTSASFSMCGLSGRYNCVVDGDTFYLAGQSIRVADIDTPETHEPRCSHEAALGARATHRMLELLNAGPFTVDRWQGRDEDQYGRKLRVVVRDGQSLGIVLVTEGLARRWTGRRESWCR